MHSGFVCQKRELISFLLAARYIYLDVKNVNPVLRK